MTTKRGDDMGDCLPIDGPVRIVPSKVSGLVVAVNRLGHYMAEGTECALRPMVEAFNASESWTGVPEEAAFEHCPKCSYPIEKQGLVQCLSCTYKESTVKSIPVETKTTETKTVIENDWF